MVLKLVSLNSSFFVQFENDVKMYGTQARGGASSGSFPFENDVKMYGTQADN